MNVLILGAAGRDFHNFNVCFKNNKRYKVVGFTATQIPNITERIYPKDLAGRFYPKGIPIYKEEEMERVIKEKNVEEVIFSYSDVSHRHVMHVASRAISAGASFRLLSAKETMLKSRKKVIAVCATRTGAGKSPLTRLITNTVKKIGKHPVVVRHPMPYGDLKRQRVQRFESEKDLERHQCTVEEREEYEPHIHNGIVVYAGVDYEKILKEAEKEADVIIWDGGNNDLPFFKPDLHIVVADARRPHHEMTYHPGETNFRMADVIVINKVKNNRRGCSIIERNVRRYNNDAVLLRTNMNVSGNGNVKGKRVIVVEDGPTVTHGNLATGAGYIFAKEKGATIIHPKKFTVGEIRKAYEEYPHIKKIIPALGYGKKQIGELKRTLDNAIKEDVEYIVSGTPVDLRRLLKIKNIIQVTYRIEGIKGSVKKLERMIERCVKHSRLKP